MGPKAPGHPETLRHLVPRRPPASRRWHSNAVGLAIAEAYLAAKFNKPGANFVDHYTYVVMGDGRNQEGVRPKSPPSPVT